jgi:hypothetical protein
MLRRGSLSSYGSQFRRNGDQHLSDTGEEYSVPILRETHRVLGTSGTMGGLGVLCYQELLDTLDPDSDVLDEPGVILPAATG